MTIYFLLLLNKLLTFECIIQKLSTFCPQHTMRQTEPFIQASKKLIMHKGREGNIAVSQLQFPHSDFKLRLLYGLRFMGSPVSSPFPKTCWQVILK